MALQKIFRSSLPSFRYFSKNGTAAIFINGKFTTDNKELEAELVAELGGEEAIGRIKSLHPFIYVDEKEPTLDTEALSPFELLKLQAKEEARRELLAEMAAQTARAMDASANVSSTSADYKSSLNNTASQQASMGTDVTLQALATTSAQAPQDASAPAADGNVTANGLQAKLANLNLGKASS